MMLHFVQEVFHPSSQHAEDERRRLEHTRVVEGDHAPGRGPVDLESGTAVVLGTPAVLPPRVRLEEAEDDEP